jgi:hypothetical protein
MVLEHLKSTHEEVRLVSFHISPINRLAPQGVIELLYLFCLVGFECNY